MFEFLEKLFRHPRPEGRASRFGGVRPHPQPLSPGERGEFSAADYDAMKRLERARDAAWARAKQKAEAPGQPIDWEGNTK